MLFLQVDPDGGNGMYKILPNATISLRAHLKFCVWTWVTHNGVISTLCLAPSGGREVTKLCLGAQVFYMNTSIPAEVFLTGALKLSKKLPFKGNLDT